MGKRNDGAPCFFDQVGGVTALQACFKILGIQSGTGLPLAIILGGEILSAPIFNEQIAGGRAVITGDFTKTEAKGMAAAMQNPPPFGFEIEGEEVIAPAP